MIILLLILQNTLKILKSLCRFQCLWQVKYRITKRNACGIKNYMLTEKTGLVVGIKVVDGSEDLLLVTEAGILIRTPVEAIKQCGRSTQGVIVMRFKEEGDRVISMALADREETPASEEAPASGEPSSSEETV